MSNNIDYVRVVNDIPWYWDLFFLFVLIFVLTAIFKYIDYICEKARRGE